jgi:divalent metal cation (Fe/Co/Zn/Cd) transporter
MTNEKTVDALKKQKTVVLILFFAELPSFIMLVVLAIMSHSLILLTNVIGSFVLFMQTWFIFMIARKLAKNESYEYDYGMGKFESFGGLITNLLLQIGLIVVFVSSILDLIEPETPGDILLLAIIVKLADTATDVFLLFRQRKINRALSGKLVEATDHILVENFVFDIIALAAIAVMYLFRGFAQVVYFEPVLCIIYSAFMIISLIKPVKLCAFDLLDKTTDEDIQLKIMKAMTTGYDLYDTFRAIRTRSSGQTVYIDLLIGFDDEKTYAQVNKSFDELEELIKAEIPNCVVSVVMTK